MTPEFPPLWRPRPWRIRRYVSRGRAALVGLLLAGSGVRAATPSADPQRERLDRQLNAELLAIDPEAVPLFEQANRARERGEHARAVELFDQVLELAPRFSAAQRRACHEHLALGHRARALELCRSAARDPAGENQSALSMALTDPRGGPPSRSELAEAQSLAEKAIDTSPRDYFSHVALCRVGMAARSAPLMRRCTAKLPALAPPSIAASYLVTFARSLLHPLGGVPPSDAELDEATQLIERAAALANWLAPTFSAMCELAVYRADAKRLERCVDKLRELDGDSADAAVYGGLLAIAEDRFDDAERELDAARRRGADPELVKRLDGRLQEFRDQQRRRRWLWGGLLAAIVGLIAFDRWRARKRQNKRPA